MSDTQSSQSQFRGISSHGVELSAPVMRLQRYLAVFEILGEGSVLHVSEVLNEVQIVVCNRVAYVGRATIKSIVETGSSTVCEVALEDSWVDAQFVAAGSAKADLLKEFGRFMEGWQATYRVLPEYKVLVADLASFLTDFRFWVEQAEWEIRAMPNGDRGAVERETAEAMARACYHTLDALFEKFEEVSATIPPELQPVHEVYARRQLHPMILTAPFAFRSVRKPLGYAGDYEIVDMILRNGAEGGSLFSKVLNGWFLRQAPAEAHRNRIQYLIEVLNREAVRVKARGKPLRVFNAGCGPAREVQDFITNSTLSEDARFCLLDFNDETVEHARRILEGIREKSGRNVEFEFIKKSVVQLVRTRSKVTTQGSENQHDLVYCAGLFDYLPDQICGYLITIFFEMVAPGGLLVVTNVDPSNPIRHWLASVLDWHLIYRDAAHLKRLCSSSVAPHARVVADLTGVNVFLEARRPDA